VALPDKAFGWIDKNKITSLTEKRSENALRKNIPRAAKLFLKTPYLWGGRSQHMPFLEGVATGVDCSGLVNLAYRISGMDIARDAHEQWMLSSPIAADQLKPGDLIFISKPNDFDSIRHVMLFLGKEKFIEAPGTGQTVCVRRFKERFGFSLNKLKEKDFIVSEEKIYFGRILT
jgi:cell wall-associated NlpC family hydrolase